MSEEHELPGWPLRDVLGDFLDRLQRRYDTHDHERPVPWGYSDVLAMLKDAGSHGLVVFTAPPSFDTESVVLRLVHHVGVVSGLPVLLLTMEWNELEIAERLVALDSGLQEWKVNCGHLIEAEWAAIGEAISRLAHCPVRIAGIKFDEPWEVLSQVKHFAEHCEVGCVVLDAFESQSTSYEQRLQLQDVKTILREAAVELGVPVTVMRPNDRWFSGEENEKLEAQNFDTLRTIEPSEGTDGEDGPAV